MTRFGQRRKALVNPGGRFAPCKGGRGPERHENQREQTVGSGKAAFLARIIFLQLTERPLLIVRRLFFIHRRNGEVAEWSKALPC